MGYTKLNGIFCYDLNSVTGIVTGIGGDFKWDDNVFCFSGPTPTPTPTPTVTPTPTPTPTPCPEGCCYIELCYGPDDCFQACSCRTMVGVYLHRPCTDDPCELAYADGIFDNDTCDTPSPRGYYSDGTDCWYWDGSSSLSYDSPC
jgi:hypothetical protein